MVAAHPRSPAVPPPRRLPLGRCALWFCLGLGCALTAAAAAGSTTGRLPGLDAGLRPLLLGWPPVLALAAAWFLALGARPGRTVEVPRRAAGELAARGIPGSARVRTVRRSRAGTGWRLALLVSVRPEARGARPAPPVRSRLVWHLEAVDAERVVAGALIPVRLDPLDPARIAFDARADSRGRSGDLPEGARTWRARLAGLRLTSAAGAAAGAAAGLALALGSL